MWSLTLWKNKRIEKIKGKHSLTFVSDLFPEASEHRFWKFSHRFSKTVKKSGKRKSYSSDTVRLTFVSMVQLWLLLCPPEQECANEAVMVLMALRLYRGIYDTKHSTGAAQCERGYAESQVLEVWWRGECSPNTQDSLQVSRNHIFCSSVEVLLSSLQTY